MDFPDRAAEMLSALSFVKYDEVAIPRILKVFRHFGIKQTFFYPAWCMETYPHLVEAILKYGHEIAAHGYLHEGANHETRERQAYWLDKQVDIFKRMTGAGPRGWRAPLYDALKDSLELLAERGFTYDASLVGDDVPYVLNTRKGEIIALPSYWAMDDWPHYMHSLDFQYTMTIKSPDEAIAVFDSEFDAMYKLGGLLVTVWHPFVSGRLARLDRVADWIEQLIDKGKVWFATVEEIAAHVKACRDDGSWQPQIENMPYYEGRIAEWEPKQEMAGD
ncbi:MAG: Peptidoglycan deacetylase [Alphaproteobacteria bacterium MarineAlpha10_Bin2]|nr:MAG: Peptidoglycan deacetylase [Alphaproteobacteria bacterium MarineAlpha10_Bin2]